MVSFLLWENNRMKQDDDHDQKERFFADAREPTIVSWERSKKFHSFFATRNQFEQTWHLKLSIFWNYFSAQYSSNICYV
jgi:hypothetical protein